MRTFTVCALLLFLLVNTLAAVKPHPPANRTRVPNEFIIDLDKDHEDRWRELAAVKHQQLQKVIDYLDNTAPYKYVLPVLRVLCQVFNSIMGWWAPYFGNSDFFLECKALSKLSGVPVGTVVLLQYMYELNANNGRMCTAILAKQGDQIIHTRNLDYEFAEMLAGISVQLNFIKNGKPIFTMVTQAGFLGAHTGIAFGKFAINVNERDKGSLLDNLWGFLTGKWGVTSLVRHVLETAQSYEEALSILKSKPLIAPVYFIVSGLNSDEGTIITRTRDGVQNITTMNDAAIQNKSYLVQTNYDRELPDPEEDYRRVPAEQKLDAMGRELTPERVMQGVMAQYPNLNDMTLLTSTMNAAQYYLNTTIWY